ncbi:ATP-binding cassette domain-containing protein [Dermacoccaceae bacterium W4C1]
MSHQLEPEQETTQETHASQVERGTEVLRLRDVGKVYGNAVALQDVDLSVRAGEVTCVLGDNGAGKSTLIKIMAGMHEHDAGTLEVHGEPTRFSSPRAALAAGIATVHQDLALAPLMSVWRNFFLGNEITRGPLRLLDADRMRTVAAEQLAGMGIEIADLDRPVSTLSGGQRQCVAIARAIHFGAQVLILDEPTAALGVKQSGMVLKYILAARDEGIGVVFITHNPHHAYLVGDRFTVLKLGRVALQAERADLSLEELTRQMAGGQELEDLTHELRSTGD